jgi:hypothetical protein
MPSTTAYRRGDIVLVLFPFTDLSASKRRPALGSNITIIVGDGTIPVGRLPEIPPEFLEALSSPKGLGEP